MKRKRKNRSNFFPTLVVIFLSWISLAAIIYFVDPISFGAVPLFFFVLFIALLFTLSTLLINSTRGLIYALAAIFFLFLRFLGVGNIINFLLLSGLVITVDLYLAKNSRHHP